MWQLMPVSWMIRATVVPGEMASHSCVPDPAALSLACSRCCRPSESQKFVVVRPAMTTVTPGASAPVIWAAVLVKVTGDGSDTVGPPPRA
jgi:hypothetical protein